MFIRKFYNEGEGKGGFVIEGTLDPQEVFEQNNNISSDEGLTVESEAETKETVQTTEDEGKTEEAKAESEVIQTPTESKVIEATTTATAETKQEQQVPDWKELVLTNKDESLQLLGVKTEEIELAKEIENDDFLKKVLSYRKEHGNIMPFLEAAGRDWDKVPDIDLIRENLRSQYKDNNLTEEEFEILENEEITERFKLFEGATESESAIGKIKLRAEAHKIRQTKKSEQQSFIDKYQSKDIKAEQLKAEQEFQLAKQKQAEEYHKKVESLPEIKSLIADKKITIGQGKDAYNYAVDPNLIVDVVKNPSKLFGLMGEAGKENWGKLNKLIAFAIDPDKYEAGLINHGRSLGTEKVVEEDLSNKQNPGTKTAATPAKESIGQAFIQRGKPFVWGQ